MAREALPKSQAPPPPMGQVPGRSPWIVPLHSKQAAVTRPYYLPAHHQAAAPLVPSSRDPHRKPRVPSSSKSRPQSSTRQASSRGTARPWILPVQHYVPVSASASAASSRTPPRRHSGRSMPPPIAEVSEEAEESGEETAVESPASDASSIIARIDQALRAKLNAFAFAARTLPPPPAPAPAGSDRWSNTHRRATSEPMQQVRRQQRQQHRRNSSNISPKTTRLPPPRLARAATWPEETGALLEEGRISYYTFYDHQRTAQPLRNDIRASRRSSRSTGSGRLGAAAHKCNSNSSGEKAARPSARQRLLIWFFFLIWAAACSYGLMAYLDILDRNWIRL